MNLSLVYIWLHSIIMQPEIYIYYISGCIVIIYVCN